jgi:hypothetical protein
MEPGIVKAQNAFCLAAALLPAPLPAQGALDALTAHLRDAALVHLDFTQTRHLQALSRPLKSSGSMVLARDKGVIWAIARPVAITYVIGPKGLLVVNPDGSQERKGARETPMVAQMGRIFQAVAQGDWQPLESLFSVTGEGRPERWSVTLLPKPQAAPFLKRIRLDGGAFVERIRIDEAGGDRQELAFEHQRTDAPLTAAETKLLNQD